MPRSVVSLFLCCTVLLLGIHLAAADYTDDVIAGLADQRSQEANWRRKGVRPKKGEKSLSDMLFSGMGNDMKEIAQGCIDSGCRDITCCHRSRSIEFKKNPLVMKILKEQWDELHSRKDEL